MSKLFVFCLFFLTAKAHAITLEEIGAANLGLDREGSLSEGGKCGLSVGSEGEAYFINHRASFLDHSVWTSSLYLENISGYQKVSIENNQLVVTWGIVPPQDPEEFRFYLDPQTLVIYRFVWQDSGVDCLLNPLTPGVNNVSK